MVYAYVLEEGVLSPRIVLKAIRHHDEQLREHSHEHELDDERDKAWKNEIERRIQDHSRRLRDLEQFEEKSGMHSVEQLQASHHQLKQENEALKRERWQKFGLSVAGSLLVAFVVWLASKLVKL